MELFQSTAAGAGFRLTSAEVIEKTPKGKPKLARISGVQSAEVPDYFGRIVMRDGYDVSPFLKSGNLLCEHNEKPQDVIGFPLDCRDVLAPDGVREKHFDAAVYLKDPQGRAVYRKSRVMLDAGGQRSLGASSHGEIVRRDLNDKRRDVYGKPAVLLQTVCRHVAITADPAIGRARFDPLVQSLSAIFQQEPDLYDFDEIVMRVLKKAPPTTTFEEASRIARKVLEKFDF